MRIRSRVEVFLAMTYILSGLQSLLWQAADSRMPVAGTASHKAEGIELKTAMKPHTDAFLISDRIFIMKSIGIAKSNFRVAGCPIVDCAAPPPGCFYQGPPATDQRGCPIDCGTLVCDGSGN